MPILKTYTKLTLKFINTLPHYYKSPINIHSAKLIYTTIIRPTLTYACPICPMLPKPIIIITNSQNKFIRKIFHAPWYIPNSQLHNELKFDTINPP